MSLKARILSVLEEGASPARDVADELGLDYRRVNAYLRDLWARGYVSRRLLHRAGDGTPRVARSWAGVGAHRPVWCYSVLDADLVAGDLVSAPTVEARR